VVWRIIIKICLVNNDFFESLFLMKLRIRDENTLRTNSQDYGADEILYTARTVLIDKTGKLMREITTLFGVYSRLLHSLQKAEDQVTLWSIDGLGPGLRIKVYGFGRDSQ
jgi:hypothetical protein